MAICPDISGPATGEILLTTLNARYAHASFGLRYLMANLGDLQSRAQIIEFEISARPIDIAEALLACNPRIIGLGVYIWNIAPATELAGILKRLAPQVTLVIGGPEVSYEQSEQPICTLADYVICGEGDLAFAELCSKLLSGRRPLQKIIEAGTPEFAESKASANIAPAFSEPTAGSIATIAPTSGSSGASSLAPPVDASRSSAGIQLPYDFYTDEDLAHRLVYVEASRGCPFKCEFCLSSLDVPVRNVPLDDFLAAMQRLLDRGLRQFKFVDRTFNLNLNISRAILQFFLDRYTPGLFLHFEMIPDRLPNSLRELIAQFPPGAMQLEVGVQTFDPEVAARISRRQDNLKLEENFRYLRAHTGVHIHADLIVGLPGEDMAGFGRGFDRLLALGPQEIQVGILKRLRGAPISRHDQSHKMVYSPTAPYEVLSTDVMDFATLQRMRRFARYWDMLSNSGNFAQSLPLLWQGTDSAFASFLALTDWLFARTGYRTHGISQSSLASFLKEYLLEVKRVVPEEVQSAMLADDRRRAAATRAARSQEDGLSPQDFSSPNPSAGKSPAASHARRQSRHRQVGDRK